MITVRSLRLLSPIVLLLATGCASLPSGKADPRDRFERFNRSIFSFNQGLDRNIAKPVARAYVKVAPAPVRTGVSNFLANLGYPVVIVNDLLQAKPVPFATDTARLVVNTTVGIGGLFDPASKLGLDSHDEDFGQTLGRWGVPPGPYLMLPVLGPSDVRDGIGKVADHFAEPKTYLSSYTVSLGLTGLGLLDKRAATLEATAIMERAFDPYAFMRNAYLQRRQFLVYDGEPPEEPVQEEDESDDSGADAPKNP
jgi:phospholipid-binding lipoprotein MlaA